MRYGRVFTSRGAFAALDIMGHLCRDALMLYVDTATTTMVWYDCCALIDVSSRRNVVLQPVQGRDYSRKELISSGDNLFHVSGRIVCPNAEEYPAADVRVFLNMMRYDGVVNVNNEVIDQYGVNRLLITDYRLENERGMKNVQPYTFTAVGMRPDNEVEVTGDILNNDSNHAAKLFRHNLS